MPTKPLPKPVSERTLKQRYAELAHLTHGRIDVSADAGQSISDLLHRYFAAFSNLYGVLLLQSAWEIFREAEPELVKKKKLLKKDFLAFSAVLRVEALPYYILNWSELDPDSSEGKPSDQLIINKKLIGRGFYRFRDLAVLMESQGDIPCAQLPRKELLAWAEPDYFRQSACARDMLRFLENLRVSGDSKNLDINGKPIRGKTLNRFIFWNKDEQSDYDYTSHKWEKEAIAARNNVIESEKLMRKIERNVQLADPIISPNQFLQFLVRDLKKVGVVLKEQQFERLFQLYTELNNKSRLWCNCGWSPEELFRAEQSKQPQRAPSISFGPGYQAAFDSGELDRAEIEQLFREKGFQILN